MARSLSPGTVWVVAQMAVLAAAGAVPLVLSLSTSAWLLAIGGSIVFAAAALAFWSMRTLGASLTPLPKPKDDSQLVVEGPYRYVRHPIYSSLILVSAGWTIVWASWLVAVLTALLFVVFLFKSRLEERWLVQRYPDYADYRRRTGGLIPRLGHQDR